MAAKQRAMSPAPAAPMTDDGLLNIPLASHSNMIMGIGLVAILATLLIPLPTFMLDMLLACSISLSIAVLIITLVFAKRRSNCPLSLRCCSS